MIRSVKKLELTPGEKFFHYSVLIYLAILPAMSLYYLFRYFVLKDYTGLREPKNFYIMGIVGFTLMVLFYIIQNRRLRFVEIDRTISDEDLEIAIGQCSFELEWQIILKTKDKIVATRKNVSIWGERITILIEPRRVLVNSICDPNKMMSMVSYGHNKENVECLRKRIDEVLKSSHWIGRGLDIQ